MLLLEFETLVLLTHNSIYDKLAAVKNYQS